MVQNICNGGEKQWIFNEYHASMLYNNLSDHLFMLHFVTIGYISYAIKKVKNL